MVIMRDLVGAWLPRYTVQEFACHKTLTALKKMLGLLYKFIKRY